MPLLKVQEPDGSVANLCYGDAWYVCRRRSAMAGLGRLGGGVRPGMSSAFEHFRIRIGAPAVLSLPSSPFTYLDPGNDSEGKYDQGEDDG
jgi:hypothetical protein